MNQEPVSAVSSRWTQNCWDKLVAFNSNLPINFERMRMVLRLQETNNEKKNLPNFDYYVLPQLYSLYFISEEHNLGY